MEHHAINKHKPWIETSYHGVIAENSDVVVLDPPLVALDKDAPIPFAGEICGFRIHGLDVPFEAVVLNETTGEGQLRAREPIDCEHQKEFSFLIQAHDCGAGPGGPIGKKSHKAVVHVQVDDVNEFSPVFSRSEYRADVTEGRVYDVILQVQASDQDCSPQYNQICNYHIITKDTPFAIDRNGNIRNTARLRFEEQTEYELQVTAFDCGQREASQSATVHISVKPVCKPGWQGWNRRVEYEPSIGSKPLFPSMHLETCGWALSSMRLMVELQTTHIGKGCDHQTSSEKALQRLCGASSGSTDLLPAPTRSTNWTSALVTEGGRDGDLIFHFDGRQAAKVPDWVAPGNLTDQFTIATWMKHGPSPGQRADKETLLCSSDKTEMNRHHYSLYVHNCRLVFLLRRADSLTDSFRPAEFHWKLEQICDKEWHYYVINVEFPMVTLYVDGVTYDPYLVTDDWPIHSSHIDVQLTVGACWQGGEISKRKFTQYFRGSLSGLTLHPGRLRHTRCFSEDECISIPDVEVVVMVMQPSEPRISITGAEHVTSPASDMKAGLRLFPDLHVTSTVTADNRPSNSAAYGHRTGVLEESLHNLDYCDILVLGEEFKAGQESLHLQKSFLLGTHLDYTNSTTGMSIYGVDSMVNYAEVMRQVRYQNLQPEISVRNFRLSCSELNGQYTSNQFNLEVNVLHSSAATEHVNHMMAPHKFRPVVHHPLMLRAVESPGVPSLAGVVLVVCVVVLAVVVVVGAYRIHVTLRQDQNSTHTLTHMGQLWDESALTITVNPMESFEDALAAVGEVTEDEEEDDEEEDDDDDDDDDEDDDITSAESGSEGEDEDLPNMQQESRRRAQQDWDNMSPF
ncbi:hypothetical protein AALO_G00203560 [Alosa alosa]|uniref:Calsyntenin-2 n=1 Tax=Alosa alosa TaxID=278164 RepID=A0AAV6G4L9_9TELE|nr:hypothetical protein AALO_G00203560 [Alosa alosa]